MSNDEWEDSKGHVLDWVVERAEKLSTHNAAITQVRAHWEEIQPDPRIQYDNWKSGRGRIVAVTIVFSERSMLRRLISPGLSIRITEEGQWLVARRSAGPKDPLACIWVDGDERIVAAKVLDQLLALVAIRA